MKLYLCHNFKHTCYAHMSTDWKGNMDKGERWLVKMVGLLKFPPLFFLVLHWHSYNITYIYYNCTVIYILYIISTVIEVFYYLGGSNGKESACSVGDLGLIPGMGRAPGGGHGNPLQYSCLENFIDRRAWRATAHGVTERRTQLNDWLTHKSFSWVQEKINHEHSKVYAAEPLSYLSCWAL